MIDVAGLRASTDLVEVVSRYVKLTKAGSEWAGCCPFHDERTPSFTVSPEKGFVHCFGCGANHDVIGFLMRIAGLSFAEACRELGATEIDRPLLRRAVKEPRRVDDSPVWVPIYPIPEDATPITVGAWCSVWNAKRDKVTHLKPLRADAYRDAKGRLMGYVLRCEFERDGRMQKMTPQVTWCIGPDGSMRWCLWPFPKPRPLCGLDELALRRVTITQADGTTRTVRAGAVAELDPAESIAGSVPLTVLVVEGEKCRAAGAGALAGYAVVCWPGGSKGLQHVDWSPLAGRDVVLWPDADVPGNQAMLGYVHDDGRVVRGVAQYAHAVGARSIRLIDTTGQPKGWDIADALDPERDNWTPKQLGIWAAQRVCDVEVVDQARAA